MSMGILDGDVGADGQAIPIASQGEPNTTNMNTNTNTITQTLVNDITKTNQNNNNNNNGDQINAPGGVGGGGGMQPPPLMLQDKMTRGEDDSIKGGINFLANATYDAGGLWETDNRGGNAGAAGIPGIPTLQQLPPPAFPPHLHPPSMQPIHHASPTAANALIETIQQQLNYNPYLPLVLDLMHRQQLLQPQQLQMPLLPTPQRQQQQQQQQQQSDGWVDITMDNRIVCDRSSFQRELTNLVQCGANMCVAAGMSSEVAGQSSDKLAMFSQQQHEQHRLEGILIRWSNILHEPSEKRLGGVSTQGSASMNELLFLQQELLTVAGCLSQRNELKIVEIEQKATVMMKSIYDSAYQLFESFILPIKVSDTRGLGAPNVNNNNNNNNNTNTVSAAPDVDQLVRSGLNVNVNIETNMAGRQVHQPPPLIGAENNQNLNRGAQTTTTKDADGNMYNEQQRQQHQSAIVAISVAQSKAWAKEKLDLVFSNFVKSLNTVQEEFYRCMNYKYGIKSTPAQPQPQQLQQQQRYNSQSQIIAPQAHYAHTNDTNFPGNYLSSLLDPGTMDFPSAGLGGLGDPTAQTKIKTNTNTKTKKKIAAGEKDKKPKTGNNSKQQGGNKSAKQTTKTQSKSAKQGRYQLDDGAGASGEGGSSGRKRQRANLSRQATNVLRLWLHDNFTHPYPNDKQKASLISSCNISMAQLNNWFINTRVRYWKPLVEQLFSDHHDTLKDAALNDKTGFLIKKYNEAIRSSGQSSDAPKTAASNAAANSISASAMMCCLISVPHVAKAVNDFSEEQKQKIKAQTEKEEGGELIASDF